MAHLPPSYLGKKVFLEKNSQRYYVIKYEEFKPPRKIHVLLFDHDVPAIFAVMDKDGKFLDSFFLSNKTTEDSAKAMERYREIAERKKKHKVTQDDLHDALKPEGEAKKKNENIMKYLKDEHLEDIKHQWPSRLIALQNADGKSSQSLIMIALTEAIKEANPIKSFDFLAKHRLDDYIPFLANHVQEHPELVEKVSVAYISIENGDILSEFLARAADYVDVNNREAVESILQESYKIDHVHYTSMMKHLLSRLLQRVKEETALTNKEWLSKTISNKELRRSIADILRSQTSS
ncbi:hypothetical protein [Salisediminibacterium halotolerans]|uniref:Uncharacterized protein n=1 Tax=Salisediminibacterium halotolerans TaxID=517425 RepID=A0A1H9UF32_9BACI|nr:hypothetical protein [Salisediminibacterium haloalkalitolerans]SES07663.1 hypothetical protein SAMN05444126_1143 [Salisediminibacterium haloalkalitolerans]